MIEKFKNVIKEERIDVLVIEKFKNVVEEGTETVSCFPLTLSVRERNYQLNLKQRENFKMRSQNKKNDEKVKQTVKIET